ncbi:MAG: hypothetical protein WBB34_18455 [Xanthobacteraceae bacterium]
MTNSPAEMNQKADAKLAQPNPAARVSDESAVQSTALDRRYRQIGISAVAAAVRYQGVAKNPAYAPVPTDWHLAKDAAA